MWDPVIVKVSNDAGPTIAMQRTAARAAEGARVPLGFTGHFHPTTQQQLLLLKQHRRKPHIARDDLWSVMSCRPPPFEEAPIMSEPFMDNGVSPAMLVQQARDRRKLVAQRDHLLITPSAESALAPDDVPAKLRFQTASREAQVAVVDATMRQRAATPQWEHTIGRRTMPEKRRSQIQFGASLFEQQVLQGLEDSVARQPAIVASIPRLLSPSPYPGGRPVAELKFANRSRSALGESLVPKDIDSSVGDVAPRQHPPVAPSPSCGPIPTLVARSALMQVPKQFNIKKAQWIQDELEKQKRRNDEFASIVRVPRPVSRIKEDDCILCIH